MGKQLLGKATIHGDESKGYGLACGHVLIEVTGFSKSGEIEFTLLDMPLPGRPTMVISVSLPDIIESWRLYRERLQKE